MDSVDDDVMQDFLIWLKGREQDIADGVEDFGELKELFFQLYDHNAGETPQPEPCW